MELLPVALYEYLFLFLLCLVSFLIGWTTGRKKGVPSMKNEQLKRGIDLEISSNNEVRAVQTRRRGGEAVKDIPEKPLEHGNVLYAYDTEVTTDEMGRPELQTENALSGSVRKPDKTTTDFQE